MLNKSTPKLKKAANKSISIKKIPKIDTQLSHYDTLPRQMNSEPPYEKSDKGKNDENKKKIKPLDLTKLQGGPSAKKVMKTKITAKKEIVAKKEVKPKR